MVLAKYIKIVYPFLYTCIIHFNRRTVTSLLILPWIIGIVSNLVYAIVPATIDEEGHCVYDLWSPLDAITISVKVVAFYILPMGLFIFCYYGIFKTLRCPRFQTSGPNATGRSVANEDILRSTVSDGRFQGGRRIMIRTLFTVTVLFVICWTIDYLAWILIWELGIRSQLLSSLAEILIIINVAANPFIYLAQFKRFRDCLQELLKSTFNI